MVFVTYCRQQKSERQRNMTSRQQGIPARPKNISIIIAHQPISFRVSFQSLFCLFQTLLFFKIGGALPLVKSWLLCPEYFVFHSNSALSFMCVAYTTIYIASYQNHKMVLGIITLQGDAVWTKVTAVMYHVKQCL